MKLIRIHRVTKTYTNLDRDFGAEKEDNNLLTLTTMPTCPTCSGTVIEYSSSAGNGFCVSCGTVVEENTIVNEISFGETSSGAAMVQGSYVGQGSSESTIQIC